MATLFIGSAFLEKGLAACLPEAYLWLRAFPRLPIAVILAFLMQGGARAKNSEILNFTHRLSGKDKKKALF